MYVFQSCIGGMEQNGAVEQEEYYTPDIVIESDASLLWWGASMDSVTAGGI